MALKIRLRQHGRTNRQTYRLVVMDGRNRRDGKYLEALGSYDPLKADNNFICNSERIQHWLSMGAELSENVKNMLKKASPELIQKLRDKSEAKRVKTVAKRRQAKKSEPKK